MTRRGFRGPKKGAPPVPDHRHDHEWRPSAGPVLEDGRAIFFEKCSYAEGEFGEKFSCEETRNYGFTIDWIEYIGGGPPVRYLAENFDHHLLQVEPGLIDIETSYVRLDTVNPDPEQGRVVVETDNWRAQYTP